MVQISTPHSKLSKPRISCHSAGPVHVRWGEAKRDWDYYTNGVTSTGKETIFQNHLIVAVYICTHLRFPWDSFWTAFLRMILEILEILDPDRARRIVYRWENGYFNRQIANAPSKCVRLAPVCPDREASYWIWKWFLNWDDCVKGCLGPTLVLVLIIIVIKWSWLSWNEPRSILKHTQKHAWRKVAAEVFCMDNNMKSVSLLQRPKAWHLIKTSYLPVPPCKLKMIFSMLWVVRKCVWK